MARPAVVAEEALKAGFFHTGLFMDAGDRASSGLPSGFAQTRVIGLGAAQVGIDEGGGSGAEIERGDRSRDTRVQRRLSLRRREEQLVGAVAVLGPELGPQHERPR